MLAALVFLAAASGTALVHEGHDDSTPTTPLEPDDDPGTVPLVAGVGGVVVALVALGIVRTRDQSNRIQMIGFTVAGLLLVYVSLAIFGVI